MCRGIVLAMAIKRIYQLNFTYLGFVVLIFVFFMGSVESHMLS